jgi:hypothetical protein
VRPQAAIAGALLASAMAVLSSAQSSEPSRDGGPAILYANETWYRERPEPEQTWCGTLRRRAGDDSPGGRAALAFSLHTKEATLPVYAAGVADRLAPYVGMRVLAAGKLVDLRSEGMGRELWVGTIELPDETIPTPRPGCRD